MKINRLLILALLVAANLSGCSDNDEYVSELPVIEDITVVNQNGNTALRAGDEVTVTIIQSKKGRLLNRTEYSWTSNPATISFTPATQSIVYDNANSNPSTKFTATDPGSFTLTFRAVYDKSGTTKSLGSFTSSLKGGGTVNYEHKGQLKAQISASKRIRIAQ